MYLLQDIFTLTVLSRSHTFDHRPSCHHYTITSHLLPLIMVKLSWYLSVYTPTNSQLWSTEHILCYLLFAIVDNDHKSYTKLTYYCEIKNIVELKWN